MTAIPVVFVLAGSMEIRVFTVRIMPVSALRWGIERIKNTGEVKMLTENQQNILVMSTGVDICAATGAIAIFLAYYCNSMEPIAYAKSAIYLMFGFSLVFLFIFGTILLLLSAYELAEWIGRRSIRGGTKR